MFVSYTYTIFDSMKAIKARKIEKGGKPRVVQTFRLQPAIVNAFKRKCKQTDVSITETIEDIMINYVRGF